MVQPSSQLSDAMRFLQQRELRFLLPEDATSASSNNTASTLAPSLGGVIPSRKMLLQELFACAACGISSNSDNNDIRLGNSLNEVALRTEIEMLEQIRRNIVLQQQHLQILTDQAQAAPLARHLVQLANAYIRKLSKF